MICEILLARPRSKFPGCIKTSISNKYSNIVSIVE